MEFFLPPVALWSNVLMIGVPVFETCARTLTHTADGFALFCGSTAGGCNAPRHAASHQQRQGRRRMIALHMAVNNAGSKILKNELFVMFFTVKNA